jgi:hypothetical protein
MIAKLRICKKKKHLLLFFIFNILLFSQISLFFWLNQNNNNSFSNIDLKNPENIHASAQETFTTNWLENPTFDDPVEPVWYSKGEGDLSDVKATAGLGHANLSVIGDQRTFSEISGTPTSDDWLNVTNPAFPALPDFHGIDEYGCEVNHTWIDPDDTNQSPSVHWERDITMPVNMSDYVITSASISAVYNASVTTQPGGAGTPNEFYGVDCPGDPVQNSGDYDTARFYVLISDLEDNETYEIAWYQTVDLGQDDPEISNITDTFMNIVVEEALIFYLNSLFVRDNYNFKVTLGIRIKCVDNFNYDRDRWDSLRIKTCNLTFTYEKKIGQTTSISWNQDGDKISNISNDTIVINEALLNFKYKIDKNWTEESPNSEIRVFIGNNKHSETIKLTNTSTSFQIAKTGGYDVTSLITYNTYINFSIQVYLADEFLLDRNITVSIDDVFLNITYTVTFPDTQSNLQVFFNGINRTLNPLFELPYGTTLNITVKYPDDMGVHISGAIIQLSGNLTGTLMENETLEQYSIIINTNELDIGDINFYIIAHKINYETRIISPIVTILKIRTKNLQLFFDNQNKTSDPVIEIPINKLLNITVKYTDDINNPIFGATLLLTGEGISENFIENIPLKHYSLIVNTSIKFIFGANQITINASKEKYQEMSIDTKITVRKINTEIKSTSGSNRININPGESALLRIYINDTDFNEIIKDSIVTYSSSLGDGVLLDSNNDGIYEVIIENAPIGTYSIFIHAYGSEIYDFKDYEIILTVIRPGEELILFQLILIGAIVATIGLGSYFYAYQKILKYPVPVRKVRKFRKSLDKKEAPKVAIMDRERSLKSKYQKEVDKSSKYLKSKPKRKPTEVEEKQYKFSKKIVDNSKTKSSSKNVNNNS